MVHMDYEHAGRRDEYPPIMACVAKPQPIRRLLRGLAISAGSLVVTFIVLEVGVRLFVPASTFAVFANVYQAHDDQDIRFTLRPSYRGRAYGAELRTNKDGFRGPDRPQAKPRDTIRIALIGDSHAFGFGVEYDQSVGRQLEKRMQRDGTSCEVWNFAIAGYNSSQELAVFKRYALAIEPDVVILVPCNNDDEPPRWADEEGWMRLAESQEVSGNDTRVQPWQQRRLEQSQRTALANSRLAMFLQLQWMRYRMRDRPSPQAQPGPESLQMIRPDGGDIDTGLREHVQAPLTELIEICRDKSIPVVLAPFTMVPEWRRLFFALHDEHEVPLVELAAAFPEAKTWADLQARFGLGWDSHLNAEAHRRWGKLLHQECARILVDKK